MSIQAPLRTTHLASAPAPPALGVSARPAWLGLAAVGIASVLVFWLFDALPFQDLPAHAGLIAMRHRFVDSPFEQRFFVLAPHIGPYSLFRFLGEGLVRVVSPTSAVRAIATLPALATPAALLFARRRLHGDVSPAVGFLGVALSFGLMTLLGFASYLFGVAVMLLVFTLWLELLAAVDRREPTRNRELVVAALGPLVFIAHGHAFLLFLALTGVSAIATGDRMRRVLTLRALTPSLLLAGWVAWLERGSSTPTGSFAVQGSNLEPHFQGATDKLSLLVTPTLMTRTGVDIAVGAAIWVLVLACAVATIRDLRSPTHVATDITSERHARALYACALAIGVLFLALPHAIGWFGFVDGRLVPIFLYLCMMAYRPDAMSGALRSALDRGAPIIASTMCALILVASYRFQWEARGYREILSDVPAEARLLNLPLDPNSDFFTAHPFIHYDKLVLAERPIVVSDIWFHQGSALYPTTANPALRLPASYSESDLRGIDWPAYRLDDWDFVLIRTRPEASAPPTPASLAIVNHRGGWWLFRTR